MGRDSARDGARRREIPSGPLPPNVGRSITDEAEIKRITDALLKAYPPGQENKPKAPETYGFDIETERRREAGFLEALRQRRWTVRAYDAQGNTVETCYAGELSAAVEIAKELEEEYPRVDIITSKDSVLERVHWRRSE